MHLKKLTYLAIAAVLGLAAGMVSNLWGAPPEERFDHKVREDFFAGFLGNQEALARGMKATEETLAANPKHAEAMVWHGGGLFFQGGMAFQAGDRNKGMDLATKGLQMMDEAVKLDPDNVGVRIPRGASVMGAARGMSESPFSRSLLERGKADFERTLEIQKAYFDQIGTHPRGELLFGLADTYSRLGETDKAQQFFERLTKDLPGTAYEKRARTWLETRSPLPVAQTGCVGCHVAK